MELETKRGNNPKTLTIKEVVLGLLCIMVPIGGVLGVMFGDVIMAQLKGNWLEVGKGVLIGLTSLPVMLFVGVKIQDANIKKEIHTDESEDVFRERGICANKTSIKRNICLLISLILGSLYSIYILNHFFGNYQGSTGEVIATALVLPHIFMVLGATIITIIAYFKNSIVLSLFSAILFSVGAILFVIYSPFIIPSIILSFVGWYQLKVSKNNKSK